MLTVTITITVVKVWLLTGDFRFAFISQRLVIMTDVLAVGGAQGM